MKRIVLWLSMLFIPVAALSQNGAVTGYCVKGATPAKTSGLNSSNTLQGVVPGGPAGCLVQVYNTGTTTPSTIYSNAGGTTLSNPFRASLSGQWLFYAATSNSYDVVLSGGLPPNTYPSPVTFTGLNSGGGSGSGGITSVTGTAPVVATPSGSTVVISLPNAVTGPGSGATVNDLGCMGNTAGTSLVDCGTPIVVKNYAAFNNAVTALGSTAGIILVNGPVAISSAYVVPANVGVLVVQGGYFNQSASITFNGPFSTAGLLTAFYGSGAVTFGAGMVGSIFPQWWGASPTATTSVNETAFNAAIVAANASGGGEVRVVAGTYQFPSGITTVGETTVNSFPITLLSNVALRCDSWNSVITGPDFLVGAYNVTSMPNNVEVRNCKLVSTDVHSAGYVDAWPLGVFVNSSVYPSNPGGSGVTFDHNWIVNSPSTAIMVSTYSDVQVTNNRIDTAGENAIEFQSFFSGACTQRIRVIGNTVNAYSTGPGTNGSGIVFFGCHNDVVVNDNILDATGNIGTTVNSAGILLYSDNFPTATIGTQGVANGNTIIGGTYSLHEYNASRTLFEGNKLVYPDGQAIDKATASNSEFKNNLITIANPNHAYTQTLLNVYPELIRDNTVNQTVITPTFNVGYNMGFANWSAGTATFPDLWTDGVGDGSGSVAVSSVAQLVSPPYGPFGLTVVSAEGGFSIVRNFMNPTVPNEHWLVVTAMVQSSTTNCCMLSIRTSDGDFYSNVAPTGASAGWVSVALAALVSSGSVQDSVRLWTAAGATANWTGVSPSLDAPSGYAYSPINGNPIPTQTTTVPTVGQGVCWKTVATLGTCTAGIWPACSTCN